MHSCFILCRHDNIVIRVDSRHEHNTLKIPVDMNMNMEYFLLTRHNTIKGEK